MEEHIKKIENTFRSATSSDELFDAFQDALKLNICGLETFKILLANPVLSSDEVKMFAEKLIKEFSTNVFDLCMWTAKIFENDPDNNDRLDDALHYYSRAISNQPTSHEPFVKLLELYNHEINLPTNQKILDLVSVGIQAVHYKSKVYYALSNHYKRAGNIQLAAKHLALAEKSAEREGR